jgi:hypothetical protein
MKHGWNMRLLSLPGTAEPRAHERAPLRNAALVATAALLAACGGAQTTRMVDEPTGSAVSYGAPYDTAYEVQVEPAKNVMQVHVFETSRCPVIPVKTVHRYRETLKGSTVVSRESLGKQQVAGEPKDEVLCNQTYARNVSVSLVVGGAVHPLGRTDDRGMTSVDLTRVFQSAAYGETPPEQAIVRIRPERLGRALDGTTISLNELKKHETLVDRNLAELESILAKGETGATSADIGRSYELYAQLHDVAPSDPRVRGISARFWELFYGRKQAEATERMGRNLRALDEARELLKVAGVAAIPLYFQAAVNSGNMDARSLEWATLRVIQALRTQVVICQQGFAWNRLGSYGWGSDALAAAHYLQFARGDAALADLNAACARF